MKVVVLRRDRGDGLQQGRAARRQLGRSPARSTAKQRFQSCRAACEHHGRSGQVGKDVAVFPWEDGLYTGSSPKTRGVRADVLSRHPSVGNRAAPS